MEAFLIRSRYARQNSRPLFWNTDSGWVPREQASVFLETDPAEVMEFVLLIEGELVPNDNSDSWN